MCFIPETLPRMVITKAAKKDLTSADQEEVLIAESKVDIMKELRFVTTMTFRIMFTEPIVLFLGIYNGFAYVPYPRPPKILFANLSTVMVFCSCISMVSLMCSSSTTVSRE